jgi:hypothetical protein
MQDFLVPHNFNLKVCNNGEVCCPKLLFHNFSRTFSPTVILVNTEHVDDHSEAQSVYESVERSACSYSRTARPTATLFWTHSYSFHASRARSM